MPDPVNLGFSLAGEDGSILTGYPEPLNPLNEYVIVGNDGDGGVADIVFDLDEVLAIFQALGSYLVWAHDQGAVADEVDLLEDPDEDDIFGDGRSEFEEYMRGVEPPLTPTSDLFPRTPTGLAPAPIDFFPLGFMGEDGLTNVDIASGSITGDHITWAPGSITFSFETDPETLDQLNSLRALLDGSARFEADSNGETIDTEGADYSAAVRAAIEGVTPEGVEAVLYENREPLRTSCEDGSCPVCRTGAYSRGIDYSFLGIPSFLGDLGPEEIISREEAITRAAFIAGQPPSAAREAIRTEPINDDEEDANW